MGTLFSEDGAVSPSHSESNSVPVAVNVQLDERNMFLVLSKHQLIVTQEGDASLDKGRSDVQGKMSKISCRLCKSWWLSTRSQPRIIQRARVTGKVPTNTEDHTLEVLHGEDHGLGQGAATASVHNS